MEGASDMAFAPKASLLRRGRSRSKALHMGGRIKKKEKKRIKGGRIPIRGEPQNEFHARRAKGPRQGRTEVVAQDKGEMGRSAQNEAKTRTAGRIDRR